MKIGIFDPYLDTLGGGEKYMLTAAACLAEQHTVSIFWDSPTILAQADIRFAIGLQAVETTPNIFSSHVSLLKRLLASRKYDCIIYLSDGSIPLVLTKKLILHFQFPLEWVQGKSLSNQFKIKRASAIVCNSLFTKGFIDKTFGVESKILYPPASGESTIGTRKKENCILSVGRYGELSTGVTFKKQEVMITMFKKMVDTGLTDWQLTLVISYKPADTEKVKKLEALAVGYPIAILYNVSNEALQNLYATAKIYWHAAGFGENLQKHPELAEHFGIATVQAMEQGTVPVVINAGGQKEIVIDSNNGYLWTTMAECIEKTMRLITNAALLTRFAQAAREKAKEFTKENFCQTLTNIVT